MNPKLAVDPCQQINITHLRGETASFDTPLGAYPPDFGSLVLVYQPRVTHYNDLILGTTKPFPVSWHGLAVRIAGRPLNGGSTGLETR